MPGIVWVALVALLATTATGVVLLAALPTWLRAVLAPAAPAIGVAGLAVVLGWLNLVLPGRSAAVLVWLVVLVAAGALLLRARHRLPTRRQWRTLGIALAIGVALALPALAPSLRAGTSWVVEPSGNNDAIWHVGMAEWFLDHRADERPDVVLDGTGADGPFVWPTALAVDQGMRRGEALVQGALSVVTGQRPMAGWSPITATWVALLPGALLAGLRLLGASRAAAGAGAVVGASSAALASQVFFQHGPSVLALCGPLPVALGLTWLAPRHRPAAVAAGVSWAGVITLYNELLPLYAPVAAVLLAARLLLGCRGRRTVVALGLAATAVVVGALPTLVHVVGYLRELAANPTQGSSPYAGAGGVVTVLRASGLLPTSASGSPGITRAVLLAAVVVGVVLAAAGLPSWRRHRARPLRLATLTLVLVVAVAAVAAHRRGEDYSTKRVIDTGAPLALALVAAALAQGARAPDARRWAPALGGVALVAVVVANASSSWRAGDIADLDERTVDADLRAVAESVRAGSPDGAGVMVAVGSYFDEHWLGLLLVDRPAVAYPSIGPGYAPGSRYGAMDGVQRVVVDREVLAALPEARATGRFAVADVEGAPWSVLLFGSGWSPPEGAPDTTAGAPRSMADQGAIVVVGADLGCPLPLTLDATQPTTVTRHVPGLDDVTFVVPPDGTVADLSLPAVPIVDGVLLADPPGVAVPGDGRVRSIQLIAAGPPACATDLRAP